MEENMPANQTRVAKVLALLLGSMTAGAIVLLVLEGRPVPAGAFSLASYSRLNEIKTTLTSRTAANPGRWDRIEVHYSNTTSGNLKQLASVYGLPGAENVNFHFLVGNGLGSGDGQIQSTERWQKQWSCIPGGTWYGSGGTLRICVIGGRKKLPTDCQMKRTSLLVESLVRKFNITAESISYPDNWRL